MARVDPTGADSVPASGVAVGHASIAAEGRLAVPRGLIRVIRRDPEHLAERLTLYAAGALGQESEEWAERKRRERPEVPVLDEAHEVRLQSARVARIDGAIAGCPLYVALVPAYVAVLYQQVRMVGRIAALEGRDPRDPQMAAEMLALRGLYPTPEAAAGALAKLPPELPERGERPSLRKSWRTWVELVKRVLILVGMLAPPDEGPGPSAWNAPGITQVAIGRDVVGVRERDAAAEDRVAGPPPTLGARAQEFYSGPMTAERERERPGRWKVRHDEGSLLRKAVRIALLALAIAIPMVLLFLAAVEQHQGHRLIWLSVLGGLTALVSPGKALLAGTAKDARGLREVGEAFSDARAEASGLLGV